MVSAFAVLMCIALYLLAFPVLLSLALLESLVTTTGTLIVIALGCLYYLTLV
jgi:hypothetical protein